MQIKFIILVITYCLFGIPQYVTALLFLIGSFRLLRPNALFSLLSLSILLPIIVGLAKNYPSEEVIRSTSGLGVFMLVTISTYIFKPVVKRQKIISFSTRTSNTFLFYFSLILFIFFCTSYFCILFPEPFLSLGQIISSNPSTSTFGNNESLELSRFMSPLTIFATFVSLYTLLHLLETSRNLLALSIVLFFFLSELFLSLSKGLFIVSSLTIAAYIIYVFFRVIRLRMLKKNHIILFASVLISTIALIYILPSTIEVFSLGISEINLIFDDSSSGLIETNFSNRNIAISSMMSELSLFGQGFGAPVSNVFTNSYSFASEVQSLNFIRMMGIGSFTLFVITYILFLSSLYDRKTIMFILSFFVAPIFVFSFSNPIAFSVQCLTFPILQYLALSLFNLSSKGKSFDKEFLHSS